MLTVLFRLGPLTFYSFGVFLSLAILVGSFLVWREGKREGFSPEKILDLVLVSLVGGVVGGRIFFILSNWRHFSGSPWMLLHFWGGNLVWYGALVSGFGAGYWLVRRNNWSVFKIGDIVAPALALGQAIGYLGCLFSGCAAPVATPVMIFYLGLFLLILRLRREEAAIGFVALFYLISSTLFDFAVGFFRRAPRRWLIFNLDQWLAIAIFVGAVLALRRKFRGVGMKKTFRGLKEEAGSRR